MCHHASIGLILSRDWRKYSKDALCTILNDIIWNYDYDSVQSYWDYFENVVIKIVDKIVPLVEFNNDRIPVPIPKSIKQKINKRNRLLKKRKTQPSTTLRKEIGNLNIFSIL